jgi:hypothetical protein
MLLSEKMVMSKWAVLICTQVEEHYETLWDITELPACVQISGAFSYTME